MAACIPAVQKKISDVWTDAATIEFVGADAKITINTGAFVTIGATTGNITTIAATTVGATTVNASGTVAAGQVTVGGITVQQIADDAALLAALVAA